MTDHPLAIAAPAKINLYLHVVGQRDDGYHELDSLIAFAGIHDTISLEPAAAVELTVGGPFADALDGEGENLVLDAARSLAARCGVEAGARIHLEKRLPVASGIGGGSADAAATLKGLRQLWEVAMPEAAWAELALDLGADVPICLHGRAAYIGGIGERIDAAPNLPATAMVLINPGVAVPTPAVFKRRSGPFGRPDRLGSEAPTSIDLATALASRGNDLFDAARALEPVIGEAVDRLAAAGGCLLARMSGSGATCFGLFADRESAAAAVAVITGERPGWWIVATELLSTTEGHSAETARY
ncbi:MAG: 4-(cytidine 5'-diphospho)-2-C-methyl-D-erythritol kinase [Alphaproteobacteria bacterium]|nr:4-(cytidine 5'-diphospho)-2-C-methyl-D-erythritol kinase [Alphaproteobacteria bacterium]